MRVEVLGDADAVARRGAALIAAAAREAAARRGRFALATSGGATPWRMLALLAEEDVPWGRTDLFQVDERFAPPGDPERNLTHLRQVLLGRVPLPPQRVHAMPVDDPDPGEAAGRYAALLRQVAGDPAVLDLVHLGLGGDGHTASLVPGDPALEAAGADVAVTGPYRGTRRMTLTLPVLNRCRRVLWVVTGPEKGPALEQLRSGNPAAVAARVSRERAVLLADAAAAGVGAG